MCSVPAALCRAASQVSCLLGCLAEANHVSQIFLYRWEPHQTRGCLLLFPMSSGSFGYRGPVFSIREVSLCVPHGKSPHCGPDTGIHYEMIVTTSGNKQREQMGFQRPEIPFLYEHPQ